MAKFSANQALFIRTLTDRTGLDYGVVAAWVAAEQPVGADYPVGHKDQNWLNIGLTDSRWYDVGKYFNNPVAAAINSARWLKGEWAVPGFGRAAPGIIRFSRTAGRPPAEQIRALQQSGWASSGYPNLPRLYDMYKKEGGSIAGDLLDKVTGPVGDAAGAVKDAGDALGDFFSTITSTSFWVRASKVIIGLGLVVIAILRFTGV